MVQPVVVEAAEIVAMKGVGVEVKGVEATMTTAWNISLYMIIARETMMDLRTIMKLRYVCQSM